MRTVYEPSGRSAGAVALSSMLEVRQTGCLVRHEASHDRHGQAGYGHPRADQDLHQAGQRACAEERDDPQPDERDDGGVSE
jgi:hypothetical protein